MSIPKIISRPLHKMSKSVHFTKAFNAEDIIPLFCEAMNFPPECTGLARTTLIAVGMACRDKTAGYKVTKSAFESFAATQTWTPEQKAIYARFLYVEYTFNA